MTKARTQLIVVFVVIAMWVIGVVVAALDGTVVLKATTPLMTLVFGWLFTQRATEA